MKRLEKLEKKAKKILEEIEEMKSQKIITIRPFGIDVKIDTATGRFIDIDVIYARMAVQSMPKFRYGEIVVGLAEASLCGKFIAIKVPLPKRNRQWTFDALNWAKDFCDAFTDSSPVHYPELDPQHLYICWKLITCSD